MSYLDDGYLGDGLGLSLAVSQNPFYAQPKQPVIIPMRPVVYQPPASATVAAAQTTPAPFTPTALASNLPAPAGPVALPATPSPTFTDVFSTVPGQSPAYIMPPGRPTSTPAPEPTPAPSARPAWVIPTAIGVGILSLVLLLRR